MIKKILTWAVIAFLVFYAFSNPVRAGQQASAVGGFLINMANGFGTFVANLGG